MPALIIPSLTPLTVRTIAASGVAGLVAWEVFARLLAPLVWGFSPEPTQLIEAALGIGGNGAQLIHIVTGLVFFPAGYVLLVRPLAAAFVPRLPWIVLAIDYGIALWVFAMYVMASLIAGMPPFLDFGPVAWASLFGHLALAIALGATAERMEK